MDDTLVDLDPWGPYLDSEVGVNFTQNKMASNDYLMEILRR